MDEDKILVEDVIPAVCATCANTIETQSPPLWGALVKTCKFDETIEVSCYDYDDVHENWMQTCGKWSLSHGYDELNQHASVMRHSCHGN